MRKMYRNSLLEIVNTIYEAHLSIKEMIDNEESEKLLELLKDCQETAVQMGTFIEESEGEGFVTVGYLEDYCEAVYGVSIRNDFSGDRAQEELDEKIGRVEKSIKEDIKIRLEVVFCPYKVSMWDSLESVWKAANDDSDCDAYVIPIPYYDRNQDRSFGKFHYEGDEYPEYVPITHYEEYNFNTRRPDVIFIHNPYDIGNYVTSVDPRFYSNKLKAYTDCLVYVPYFLFPKDPKEHLINTYALDNVDYIMVQNEETKKAYIDQIEQVCESQKKPQVIAIGSPKTDKIYNVCEKGIDIPKQWKTLAEGKKRMFMNTNVSLILNNNDKFVENISRVFKILEERGDVFVVWREHPLTDATLKSMRPGMIEKYNQLKKYFVDSGLGVIDTNVEAHEAMYFSDFYFGAGGSLVPIYAVTGKPMMLTAYKYPENIIDKEVDLSVLLKQTKISLYFSERYKNFLNLFLDNFDYLSTLSAQRLEHLSKITLNIDGTVGEKIMDCIKEKH